MLIGRLIKQPGVWEPHVLREATASEAPFELIRAFSDQGLSVFEVPDEAAAREVATAFQLSEGSAPCRAVVAYAELAKVKARGLQVNKNPGATLDPNVNARHHEISLKSAKDILSVVELFTKDFYDIPKVDIAVRMAGLACAADFKHISTQSTNSAARKSWNSFLMVAATGLIRFDQVASP